MLQHLKPPLYGILILEEFQIISYNNKSFFPEVIEITSQNERHSDNILQIISKFALTLKTC